MCYLSPIIDQLLHIDVYLNTFVSIYGFWTYLALFTVIFCETGLVITPFLPGDSLLFAAGSIAAQAENPLNILLLFSLLFLASVLGNQINFFIAQVLGLRIFSAKSGYLFNKKYLEETRIFYETHGGKTIILARFIPIIRSFAPFVAGIANMPLLQFFQYNLLSGLIWVAGLLSLGYVLGSIPMVKQHFSLVIYGVIFISVLPAALTLLGRKRV